MSRIEQLIGEIEEYIDSCKFQPLSNTKILVNKEELEGVVALGDIFFTYHFKKPDSDEIYELIAKSLTDKLSDDELKSLEEWKLSREINLQEYNDIVTLWTQSGSLRLPESIDLIRARNVIYGKANIQQIL